MSKLRFLFIFLSVIIWISANTYGWYRIPSADLNEFYELKQIVIDNPESPTAHFELAMNYAYTGRVITGWDSLKRVNELDPDYSSKVIQFYEQKITQEPDRWHHYFKLAFGYYFTEQKDLAYDQFLTILELEPDNFWAMAYIALLEADKENYSATISWSKRALSYNNDLIAVHWLIAKAYKKKGRPFAAFGHRLRMMKLLAEDKMFQEK